ncbi:hypothetical protein NPIL_472271 [Nephila pilipes]|uniref:Uncharacterized protein n=1 Tax=Nephila pilipes TaxID=299642 RepID=A0A8X6T644_NEPPI|nr:hypothetical protein NPIL_472271 [Nephila pilipes]
MGVANFSSGGRRCVYSISLISLSCRRSVVTGTLGCPWLSVTHPRERPSLCVCGDGGTAAADGRNRDVTSHVVTSAIWRGKEVAA